MRPDLLLICCDQLSALALGRGDTPIMDALTARGTAFATACTTCPLCMPARASFWSGLLPHRTGVTSNGRWLPVPAWPDGRPTLGRLLSAAGYDCRHFGKTHDAGSLAGFALTPETEAPLAAEHPAWPLHYDSRRDAGMLPLACAALAAAGDHRPRCLAIDINNPHDICNWVGDYHAGLCRADPPGGLPDPLANAGADDPAALPRPLQYVCCAHNRQAQAAAFGPEDWRRYLAAYRHYVRRADACVGALLGALHASGRAGATTVVLWADHGDGMGAHGLATKHTAFYEEAVRVPFLVAGPGVPAGARVDATQASLADLLPTIAGLAGLDAPPGDGLDLSGWLGTARPRHERRQAVAEWWSEWGSTCEPGRMLRERRWKYVHYREGDGEQLFDLAADPGERRNLAGAAVHAGTLARLRADLAAHLAATDDPYLQLAPEAAARWRSHAPGSCHHLGPAAPQVRAAATT